MKTNLLLIFTIYALLGFLSCNNNDPCKGKDCAHGVCFDGTCDCEAGYTKDANGNCTVNICDALDCVHGTCIDGICNCDPGYEKDADGRCTVVNILNFIPGSYDVSEDCSLTPPSLYFALITQGSTSNEFRITNFWEIFSNPVKVTVDGFSLTIARQEPDSDHFFVEGTGTFTKNSSGPDMITFSYTVTDETNPNAITSETCTNTVYVKL